MLHASTHKNTVSKTILLKLITLMLLTINLHCVTFNGLSVLSRADASGKITDVSIVDVPELRMTVIATSIFSKNVIARIYYYANESTIFVKSASQKVVGDQISNDDLIMPILAGESVNLFHKIIDIPQIDISQKGTDSTRRLYDLLDRTTQGVYEIEPESIMDILTDIGEKATEPSTDNSPFLPINYLPMFAAPDSFNIESMPGIIAPYPEYVSVIKSENPNYSEVLVWNALRAKIDGPMQGLSTSLTAKVFDRALKGKLPMLKSAVDFKAYSDVESELQAIGDKIHDVISEKVNERTTGDTEQDVLKMKELAVSMFSGRFKQLFENDAPMNLIARIIVENYNPLQKTEAQEIMKVTKIADFTKFCEGKIFNDNIRAKMAIVMENSLGWLYDFITDYIKSNLSDNLKKCLDNNEDRTMGNRLKKFIHEYSASMVTRYRLVFDDSIYAEMNAFEKTFIKSYMTAYAANKGDSGLLNSSNIDIGGALQALKESGLIKSYSPADLVSVELFTTSRRRILV